MKTHLFLLAAASTLLLGFATSANALQTTPAPTAVAAGLEFTCKDGGSTDIYTNPTKGEDRTLTIELGSGSDESFVVKVTPVDKDGNATGEPVCHDIEDGVLPEDGISVPKGSKVSIEDNEGDTGTKAVSGTYSTTKA